MSLRIFSALALAGILAACAPNSDEPDGESIDCAIGPGAELQPVCMLEPLGDGLFVIQHPDNTFQRFEYVGNEMRIVAADGADPVVDFEIVDVGQGMSGATAAGEFMHQGNRYRFGLELVARSDD